MDENSAKTIVFIEEMLAIVRAGQRKITACQIEAEMVEGTDGVWKTSTPTGATTWTIRTEWCG